MLTPTLKQSGFLILNKVHKPLCFNVGLVTAAWANRYYSWRNWLYADKYSDKLQKVVWPFLPYDQNSCRFYVSLPANQDRISL